MNETQDDKSNITFKSLILNKFRNKEVLRRTDKKK
jgi:hypothetical protein